MNHQNISTMVSGITPSATIAVSDAVQKLKTSGIDLISFSEGEPDFGTPQHIIDAADLATQEGFTKYTAVEGVAELRAAICDKLWHENKIVYPGHFRFCCANSSEKLKMGLDRMQKALQLLYG